MGDENFRLTGIGIMEHVLDSPVAALRLGWIVGGVDQPVVLLRPARVEPGTHYALFILVQVEDANGGGIVLPVEKMGVTDESAIGREALRVVTIGPDADIRFMSKTPDAKVVARGGKFDFLCAERKRESEHQENQTEMHLSEERRIQSIHHSATSGGMCCR